MGTKLLKFVGSSLDSLRDFPEEARRVAGFELRAIQNKILEGYAVSRPRSEGNPNTRTSVLSHN